MWHNEKKQKAVKSSDFCFTQKHSLVYVPAKNRAVILLSTEHNDSRINPEPPDQKPVIKKHYIATKGDVDTVDKQAKEYTTKRKTPRWPVAIFYNILDIADTNSFCAWTLQQPKRKKNIKTEEEEHFSRIWGRNCCFLK